MDPTFILTSECGHPDRALCSLLSLKHKTPPQVVIGERAAASVREWVSGPDYAAAGLGALHCEVGCFRRINMWGGQRCQSAEQSSKRSANQHREVGGGAVTVA